MSFHIPQRSRESVRFQRENVERVRPYICTLLLCNVSINLLRNIHIVVVLHFLFIYIHLEYFVFLSIFLVSLFSPLSHTHTHTHTHTHNTLHTHNLTYCIYTCIHCFIYHALHAFLFQRCINYYWHTLNALQQWKSSKLVETLKKNF